MFTAFKRSVFNGSAVTPRRPASAERGATFARRGLQFETLEERSMLSADAVLDWNAVALQAVADDHSNTYGAPEQGGPTRTAYALAIVHAAMFDAANAIDNSYTSYVSFRRGPAWASIDVAVAKAAHDTLAELYPHQKAVFDAALRETLNDIPHGRSEKIGLNIGRDVASDVLRQRRNDGSQVMMNHVGSNLPGHHRPDPLHPDQGLLTPDWGKVKPFAMNRVQDFDAPPVPAMTSQEYTDAYQEVKLYGQETSTIRTAEQTETGIFWGYDGSPGLGTPPRLYNQIVRTVAIQEGNTEVENARLFALVNIAMADAGIASWHSKYMNDFWRPVIAIREADVGTGPTGLGDGNPDTIGDVNWRPLGAPASNASGTNFTPPFPAYTSGHATFGAAMFQTLTRFHGTNDIAFSFTSDEFNGVTTDSNGVVRPVVTRHYDSFSQAAEENGQSRIYLGIHWAFDKTAGIAQGNKIADYVYDHLLKPHHPHGGLLNASPMPGEDVITSLTPLPAVASKAIGAMPASAASLTNGAALVRPQASSLTPPIPGLPTVEVAINTVAKRHDDLEAGLASAAVGLVDSDQTDSPMSKLGGLLRLIRLR